MWARRSESGKGRFFRKDDGMRAFLCLMLVSGILNTLMPEGNARGGVRMITGLLGIKMIADFLHDAVFNFF